MDNKNNFNRNDKPRNFNNGDKPRDFRNGDKPRSFGDKNKGGFGDKSKSDFKSGVGNKSGNDFKGENRNRSKADFKGEMRKKKFNNGFNKVGDANKNNSGFNKNRNANFNRSGGFDKNNGKNRSGNNNNFGGEFNTPEEELVKGTISLHPKGFGFLEVDAESDRIANTKLPRDEFGRIDDFFIPAPFLNGAMQGDAVLCALKKDEREPRIKVELKEGEVAKDRYIAKVERILKRGLINIVGTFNKAGSFVTPDNTRVIGDIFIKKEETLNAKDGEKVVTRLINLGEATRGKQKKLEGKIVEIIGDINAKGVDIKSVARDYNLYETFPDKVINESNKVPSTVDDNLYPKRKKFYTENVCTIDGEDSRDFDDAVHIIKEGDNFRAYVHIADVGEYVRLGTAMDDEAFLRATSVYFPHWVLPMLPERISNGICSLNPHEKRLTLTCEVLLDPNAEILESSFYESIIISKHRLTYNLVDDVLEGKGTYTPPDFTLANDRVPIANLKDLKPDCLRNRFEIYQ
jgi:ribonuclease R